MGWGDGSSQGCAFRVENLVTPQSLSLPQGFLEALGCARHKVMGDVKSTEGRLPTANQHKGGQAPLPGWGPAASPPAQEGEVTAADTSGSMGLSSTPRGLL